MTSFSSSSLAWLRRLVRGPADEAPLAGGAAIVMDGESAVAAVEASISEAAGLGATFPAAVGARVWGRSSARREVNRFGTALGAVEAGTGRAALAGAIGLAMSGRRAVTFLSGPDLLAALDLLSLAAGQHLPLVVHLACRAATGHAQALGSGHRAYHAAADSGCFLLFATNVQEAVDLALIARRVSERTLVPGIVAMDVEQTAAAAQDVRLPAAELARRFLGPPSQTIDAPTEAQRLLYGETRRLVPHPFDLDQPALLSSLQGPEAFGLGAAGQRVYFQDHVATCLEDAFRLFGELTGRTYAAVEAVETARAGIVLAAEGATAETLAAFAGAWRRQSGQRIGTLGLRALRPLPAAAIAEALDGAEIVAVLERDDAPAAGDGMLARELRSAFDHAKQSAGKHRGDRSPRFITVPYGIGGLPLRTSDLQALMHVLQAPEHPTYCVGLDFVRASTAFPKQQALMDTLRRSLPHLERIAVRGDEPPLDLRPDDAVTIAIHRAAGKEGESFAGHAAGLIHRAFGGGLRTRPALTWQRFEQPCTDLLTHATAALRDPGDDVPVDISVVARSGSEAGVLDRLVPGGIVICADRAAAERIRARRRDDLVARELSICFVPVDDEGGSQAPWRRAETLLGGLLAVVAARRETALTAAKARGARAETLRHLAEAEQESHLEAFVRGFESLARLDLEAEGEAGHAGPSAPEPPRPPRDVRIDDLSRSWDHIGVFYRAERTAELSASPQIGSGMLPARSSGLRPLGGARSVLPVLDPARCDGHPALWTTCPDGSMLPLVISARALIDRGIELAGERGRPADSLRAIAGQLAKRINKAVAAGETEPSTFGGLLAHASEAVLSKMGDDDPRRASLGEAVEAVADAVGALPVARTPVFFDEPERQSPGSGELFALIADPDLCKSPELLLAAGEAHGVRGIDLTPDALGEARRLVALWRKLPDTAGATIERARKHADIGPLAAVMLSRHCLHAMSGGDGAEPASGAKLSLRNVLGLAEFHLQPRQQKFLAEIDEVRGRLDERIHDALAAALPSKDLDALADGLERIEAEDFDLGELSGKVDTAVAAGRVDAAALARLVDVARALADLRWRVGEGPSRRGRARAGVVVAGGSVSAWAGAFPYNPFQNPAVIDASGEVGPLALGLLEGQLRQVIDGFRVIRRAKLELDAVKAGAGANELPQRFADLTEDERLLCPPILIVSDGRGLADLAWMLDTDLPVKVIALSGAGDRIDGGLGVDALDSYPAVERIDPAILALLSRKAFVVQTSFAFSDHFARSVLDALAFAGPAFIHLYAPSPERHGFDPRRLHEQARLAVETRALPLLRFDPGAEGVFGSRLDLTGNPALTAPWHVRDGVTLTPAEWAVTEHRFEHHFHRIEPSAGDLVPVAQLLDLPTAERTGRNPSVIDPHDPEARLCADERIIADATERARIWRTLQELAGIVTPFTRKIRADVEQEHARAHQAEIESLKKQYEERIARLRTEFEAEAAERVTQGLLTLAGYTAGEPSIAGQDA